MSHPWGVFFWGVFFWGVFFGGLFVEGLVFLAYRLGRLPCRRCEARDAAGGCEETP